MKPLRLVMPMHTRSLASLVAACVVGIAATAPLNAQMSVGPSSSSAEAGSNARMTIVASKAPFVVRIDEGGSLAKDAVKRVLSALDEHPGRLVTLSVNALDVLDEDDAEAQATAAAKLQAIFDAVRKARPGAALALRGLPLEDVRGSKAKARAINDRFAKVVKAADALVLNGGVIGSSAGEGRAVAKAFPEAMRLAGKRAVLFKGGSGWKSRVPRESAPALPSASSVAGQSGQSSEGAGQAVAAASTAGPVGGGESPPGGEQIGEILGGWGGNGAGDLNGDGVVDAIDLAIALSLPGASGGPSNPDIPADPLVVIQPADSSASGPEAVNDPAPEAGGGGDGGGDSGGDGDGGDAGGDGGDDEQQGNAGSGGQGGGDDPPANGGGQTLDTLFLANGSGFSAPTAVPPAVGQPSAVGYDAEVIARWSTVPFQTFKDKLRVGVVAFHRNGIERVAFSANGGAWVDATTMSINPTTGISEYWVTLKASDFPDGAVEIRAIAYPKDAGIPRVLGGAYQTALNAPPALDGEHSMFAWSNFAGTLDRDPRYVSATGDDANGNGSIDQPFLTLSRAAKEIQAQYGTCDNGVIYCLPGEYDFDMKWGSTFAKANDRFLTITAAPGVLREQVFIEEARPKTARVRLQNVSVKTNDAGNFYTGYNDLRTVLWLENCYVSAKNGRYGSTQKVLMTCTPYVTESTWFDAPDGPTDAVMVRNTNISKLCSDMVSGVQVVLNVTGGDIDPADTGAHPDIYQIYRPTGSFENHVIYGVRASNFLAQGVFIASLANGEKIKNCAFVNLVLDANQSNFTSQVNRESEHLLIVNCTFDQTFYIRIGSFDDVSFVGNIFKAVTLDLSKCTPAQVAVIDWRHNHFIDATSYGTYTFGTDITTGPAPVVNWAAGDFSPVVGGGLVNRVQSVYSNYDAAGSPREPMTAVGALED
jgi:hypothetical protein